MIEFGPKSPALAFDDAWLYCATLTHNNKYDWRMTNYDEYYDSNMNEIMYGYGWVDDGSIHHVYYGSIHEEELAVFIDSVIPVRTKDD